MSNSNISSTHVASFPLATVVEYLESSMSRELLCKFPDKSAFGFDYAQSSIWSPLLPRRAPTPDTDAIGRRRKRLSFGDGKRTIKKKFTDTVLRNVGGCTRMKRRKKRKSSVGFSPVVAPSSPSSSPKGWAKVTKAAANYLRRRKSNQFAVGNF